MSLSQLLLCLMFHKSQLSTTVTKPTVFVIQPPLLPIRRMFFDEPKRSATYNPSHGFEPYWPDGGWVFDRLEVTTEKEEDTVCGNECIEMYKGFGEICGRNKYYDRKTFENYCELLDHDCTGREKWMIVYRGACVAELPLYPTGQSGLHTRVVTYEISFESLNPDKIFYNTRVTTVAPMYNTRLQCRGGHLPFLPNSLQQLFGGGQKTTREHYNPNYGYEPYWDNGDWVFKEEELPPGVTTTSIPLVCGEECVEIYTSIGEVCGRKTSNLLYDGCSPTLVSWFCSGIKLDDQTRGYETFPTFCKFQDRQCREEFENSWIFVHPGPCVVPHTEIFRPFSISDLPISRMEFYLTSLASLFDNYTIEHTIFS